MQGSQPERERIREPLYVGRIITQTFSILFRKIGYVIVFALIPALALVYFELQLSQPPVVERPLTIELPPPISTSYLADAILSVLALVVIRSIIIGIIAAAMVNIVYKVISGRSVRPGALVSSTATSFPRAFTVLVLLLIGNTLVFVPFGIAITLGILAEMEAWFLIFLFCPIVLAIWIKFGLAIPVSVFEGIWFRAFSRSLYLTKDYQCACFGIFVVIAISGYLILAAIEIALLAMGNDLGSDMNRLILSVASYALLAASLTIAATLLYLRLREIKEFGIAEDVGKIFA